ncbi:hypothetical protein GCK32_011924 [Trichostrongylus colubriformis]|uniref:Uncharacterized protein n=1 Tax=Trichostrongylus colubriformis TaxID=6319 RepID=A0AAN8IU10_TRICO
MSPPIIVDAYLNIVDPFQENLTYSGIVIEKMEGFTGRAQPQCNHYKILCHQFMKCFGNCESFLFPASELNDVNEEMLTDEQEEEARHIMTNPCVGMFAYCLSVDYFHLATILDLTTPDAF